MKINTCFLMLEMKIELLKRYNDVFNGLINKIKKIDDAWLEYTKDYTKIKFNSDDNLPLKFYHMTITIR